MCMQHISSTITDPQTLGRELDELDRLIHRIKERLSTPKDLHRVSSYDALRKLRGILKGKLVEDPLHYQQRIRAESDARIIQSSA